MVIDLDTPGSGSSDATIAAYARRSDRRILTADDDQLAFDPDDHAGILYRPNPTSTRTRYTPT